MISGAQRPQGRPAARRRSGAARNRAEDQRAEARWLSKNADRLWHAAAFLLAIIITFHVLAPSLGAALWRITQ